MAGDRRCEHVHEDGTPCKAAPMSGSGFCWFHDPAHAEARTEARRRGGHASIRRQVLDADAPDLTLDNVRDVLDGIESTVNLVRKGRLDNRAGNCIGYLLGIALKALETEEVSVKVRELERRLDEMGGKRATA